MIKKVIKKKTRAKKSRKAVVSPAKILAEAPINAAHKAAIAMATKASKAEERANAALAKAMAQKDVAEERINKVMAYAKIKKTEAAKNAIVKAKAAKVSAVGAVKAAKIAVVQTAADIKGALRDIPAIKNKVDAKNKAVAAFTKKWEKAYDLKAQAKAKKKTPRKPRAKKSVEAPKAM